jgi:hypothetical protein
MPGETRADYSRYLLLSTMSGGTTLQPTIRCPLCLAESQLTISSIYSALLGPVVQHYNQLFDALYGILSGETTLQPTVCFAPLCLERVQLTLCYALF